MNEYTKKQLEQKEDMSTNDYHAVKLEKALEQLNIATDVNKLGKEEEGVIETCCSEEDASYNVT